MASSNRSELAVLRHQGYRGITILRHRAFRTLPLKPVMLLHSVLIAAGMTIVWLIVSPFVGRLWGRMFETWLRWLGFPVAVSFVESKGTYFNSVMPHVEVSAGMPNTTTLIIVGLLTASAVFVSFRLPVSMTPMSYVVRAICFIQATAIFYFALFPQYFPYDLSGYISTMLGSTMAFISAIPAIMSFTFYIFDLSLVRKLLLTILLMAHLVVLTPFQYLFHVYLIANWSMLLMPVLYIMFGLLLQIGVFIAFYSWGMSWPGREEQPWRHEPY